MTITRAIIPAQPGYFVLIADQREQPTSASDRVPIIAWRIDDNGAHPILPEGFQLLAKNDDGELEEIFPYAIQAPDGALYGQGDILESVERWLEMECNGQRLLASMKMRSATLAKVP